MTRFEMDYLNTPASGKRPQFHYIPVDYTVKPVVSIITPFFNTGEIFTETAQSVLLQSFQQWEWLIINDGSSDPLSGALLDKYRGIDPRIRVIDHPYNRGLPAARNTGIQESVSDYVVLLDSDDLLEPTAIEKWYWFLETHPEWSFVGGYSVGFGARQYVWHNGFHDNEKNVQRNLIDHTSMVRKSVAITVGGFNESMRGGLEDWDFWMSCAAKGFWGTTIREYLNWYRTRASHTDKWENLQEQKVAEFSVRIQQQYPELTARFGDFVQKDHYLNEPLQFEIPCKNLLNRTKPRLLFILPWLSIGGADKFNIDLLNHLSIRGWEISIVTTLSSDNQWKNEFEKYTPDIFVMSNFLDQNNFPRFIRYFIESRSFDAVLISNSQLGYMLLPFIRSYFPQLPLIDYNHAIAKDWKSGGFPRFAAQYTNFLNKHIVSSLQLKNWIADCGVYPEKISVCHINVDSALWKPNPEKRKAIREKYNIDSETPVVFFVARLVQNKQPDVFAETMLSLYRKGYQFKSFVIGDGPELAWLNQFICENELQDVIVTLGAISNESVREWLAVGDMIFLPSKAEGISLSFYEGMSCGLIPIGSDVGGQRELVTPDCGYLIPRSDAKTEISLYQTIFEELFSDPLKMKQMSTNARERIVNSFDLSAMGVRMDALIRQTIEEKNSQVCVDVPLELGQLIAQNAVDFSRVESFSDYLWSRLAQQPAVSNMGEMPPASASTYFYFFIRKLFFRPYQFINGKLGLKDDPIKDLIKRVFVH